MKKLLMLILFAASISLTGCVDKEDNVTKNEKPAEQKAKSASKQDKDEAVGKEADSFFADLPKVPETTAELIHQPAGKFATKEVLSDEVEAEVIKEIKDLPPLKEEATEEDYQKYFQYVYSLVAEDFDNPQDLISKWEFSASGNPDMPNSKYQFKENYNVEVILDSSGSMAQKIGGKTRMELAKEAITNFLSSLPEEANVSLRVYGHKGTGKDSDKAASCGAIEQVYGFSKYDAGSFTAALDKFKPSGWTPVAESLESSKKAFGKFDGKINTNLIYLVSDGIETCDGDPVAVAKSFADSNISPIINVIGFEADQKAQQQLKDVAKSANGIYTTVNSQEQLEQEFERAQEVLEKWEEWKNDSIRDADAQRVDNNFDILGFSNDWGYKQDTQRLNVNHLLYILKDEKKITHNQMEKLRGISFKHDELVQNAQDEINETLKELNLKSIEELKKQINEKYNSSTQN
ncbi:VWA domain-containing protein [Neobacillus sp. YIM B06451]|uniref:VWA domain-containing protein n=1 Tax=Neobacillus sp. YIM B06451 TaxID=3070994 RepID=UPI0029305E65|nr:VWA domain-containing protein [Neobacillus sp. YIM B06451]